MTEIDPTRFDGLTLEQAYERFVFAPLANLCFDETGRNIRHVAFDWWPCCSMTRYGPIEDWLSGLERTREPPAPYDPQRRQQLVEALAAASTAFLEPLQSGLVQAEAHSIATGQVQTIHPSLWKREATRIKILDGEIGRSPLGPFEREIRAGRGAVLNIDREFFGIGFRLRSDSASGQVELKNKGGRPPEYDWDRAIFYLFKWMQNECIPLERSRVVSIITQIIENTQQKTPARRQVEQELERRLPGLNRLLLEGDKTSFPTFLLTLKPDKL